MVKKSILTFLKEYEGDSTIRTPFGIIRSISLTSVCTVTIPSEIGCDSQVSWMKIGKKENEKSKKLAEISFQKRTHKNILRSELFF